MAANGFAASGLPSKQIRQFVGRLQLHQASVNSLRRNGEIEWLVLQAEGKSFPKTDDMVD